MNGLEELKKKLSDIEIQNLAMEGCSPTFTVSDIMDLIDSVELAQNSPNACTDGDTISRQAAIDIVTFECGKWTGLAKEISKQLKQLPSADLVPVVRCKYCIHNNDCDIQYSAQAGENFFCGFGETEKDVREDVYE